MFDHCDRLSNASLFQRGHGLVTSMFAIVTNKVLAAYYFSKKDVMAISTFKKLNEAQQFKSARRPHEGGEYSAEVAASLVLEVVEDKNILMIVMEYCCILIALINGQPL